jgi:RND superfamily putative drug exporter
MSLTAEPSALRRLGRFCYRRHWLVLGVWIAVIVGSQGLAAVVGDGYSQSFGGLQSESTRGFELLEQGFGGTSGENRGTIVFTAEQGVADPVVQAAMSEFFAWVEGLVVGGVVSVVSA